MKPISIKLLKQGVVWIQYPSLVKMDLALRLFSAQESSQFYALERRMELQGRPSKHSWFKFKGVPLHAWKKRTFGLQGKCLGQIVQIEECTLTKEELRHGRVKVQCRGC